jgi:hypothetical protein
MIMNKLVVLIVVSVLATGCAWTGRDRYVAYAIDTSLMVVGTYVLVDAAGTTCSRGEPGPFGDVEYDLCDAGRSLGMAIGAVALLVGTVALITTALANSGRPESPVDEDGLAGATSGTSADAVQPCPPDARPNENQPCISGPKHLATPRVPHDPETHAP